MRRAKWRCSSSGHPLAFPREFVKTGPLSINATLPLLFPPKLTVHGSIVATGSFPSCRETGTTFDRSSSFAFDIRSPLHSHENQFPTLYDLCKIDLPNGRTDAASLVTLATGEGRPMAVINIRTGNFASLTRVSFEKTSYFFFSFFAK